ncbi:hypothetical protein DRP07_00030 [Archaeoglobales archaeon]|nr:MAG: hypothetical protein DRP07_00030 [Archaeoglobales archaeon]
MRALIAIVLAMLIAGIPLAVAQSSYQLAKANFDVAADGQKNIWGVVYVNYGEGIQVNVKVENTGTVTLNGFKVGINLHKPDGTWWPGPSSTNYQWYTFSDTLSPGQSVTKGIQTGVTADQTGWWSVGAKLTMTDGTYLSYDSGDFEVEALEATITIQSVVGYTIAGLIFIGLAWAVRRAFGG